MGHQDYHSRLLKHISHSGPRLKPLSSGRPDFRISVLKPAQLSDNSFPPLMRQRTKTFFFLKYVKNHMGPLWGSGHVDSEIWEQSRELWKERFGRKIKKGKLYLENPFNLYQIITITKII